MAHHAAVVRPLLGLDLDPLRKGMLTPPQVSADDVRLRTAVLESYCPRFALS
jgi:hypothetical protein